MSNKDKVKKPYNKSLGFYYIGEGFFATIFGSKGKYSGNK
jgi:hypothetical protein